LYALFNEVEKYKRIDLRYGARTPEDIVYKNEVNTWAKGGNEREGERYLQIARFFGASFEKRNKQLHFVSLP